MAYYLMHQTLNNPSGWLPGTMMFLHNVKTNGGYYSWYQFTFITGGKWDGDHCYDPGQWHVVSFKVYHPQVNAISRNTNKENEKPHKENEKMRHGIQWESEGSNGSGGHRGILDGPARDIGIGLPGGGNTRKKGIGGRGEITIIRTGTTDNGNKYEVINLLNWNNFPNARDSIIYNDDGSTSVYRTLSGNKSYIWWGDYDKYGNPKKWKK